MAFRQPQLSVVTRLLLLLIFGMVALLSFTWFHFWEHESQERTLIQAYVADFSQQVDLVLDLHRESLETFVYDYSWWDDMVDFVGDPNDEAWRLMADGVPEIFHVDVVWIYNVQGELVYGTDISQEDIHDVHTSPFSPKTIREIFDEEDFPVFFSTYKNTVVEVAASRIHQSDSEHDGEMFGYLVAARYWTPEYLNTIGISLASSLERFSLPQDDFDEDQLVTYPEEGEVSVFRLARDYNGNPILAYTVHHTIPGLYDEARMLDWHSSAVFAIVVFYGLVFLLCLVAWVVVPLRRLSQALEGDEDAIQQMPKLPGKEWERLKDLIAQSIEQSKALKEENRQRKEAEEAQIASEASLREHYLERERLARDLHDGVIQSVYASGLQVETARLELERNPEGARKLLTEARQSLNILIADMRRFISGLTPSRLAEYGLLDSVKKLIKPLGQSGIAVKLNFEDAALESLSKVQEVQLFFIIQELLSNAVRHAKPSQIDISMTLEDKQIELNVQDNGSGFDLDEKTSNGYGLKNIKERADIMGADVSFCCPEGGGGCVCLTLPIS